VSGHRERPPSTDLSTVPGFLLLLLFVVRTLTILLGKTTTNTFRFATLSVSDLQASATWTVKKPNDIIVICYILIPIFYYGKLLLKLKYKRVKTNKNAIDQTIIDDILWVSQPSAGLAAPD